MRYDGNVSTDAGVSPGFIRTDFAESITDVATKAAVKAMDDIAISPEAVARAIAFAIEQPADVEVGDIRSQVK